MKVCNLKLRNSGKLVKRYCCALIHCSSKSHLNIWVGLVRKYIINHYNDQLIIAHRNSVYRENQTKQVI